MKFVLTILLSIHFLLFQCFVSNAQKESDVDYLLNKYVNQVGLFDNSISQAKISSTYLSSDGVRMIYLQQYILGYPVFNSMKILAFRSDSLLSVTGDFIKPADLSYPNQTKKIITPESAINKVFVYLHINSVQKVKKKYEDPKKAMFEGGAYSYTDMIADLFWLQKNDSLLQLVWQIDLSPVHTADHFQVRVDAYNNTIVDVNNLTVYESDVNDSVMKNNSIKIENNQHDSLSTRIFFQPIDSILYRVIPFPNESPSHLLDSSNIPFVNAYKSINNHSFSWHFDGNYYHDSTKGNNVWAQEDRDNNNTTYGKSAISHSNRSVRTFDANPDFSLHPTVNNNQDFAITNLFYWNNIMHDLTYSYGFDEVSGNFQMNNFGKGGLSNDFVIADAQDAGGFNNANFSTPIDGISPRMQMYLFANTNGVRDADLDNGIIVHEYTHGLTNRLTGGPGNSSCLMNAEQPGEGWSDYFSLMMTTNWSTATILDGAKPKTIGSYALGQSINGNGVRTFPYSTNMQINPWTYAMMSSLAGNPHKNGEIWCAVLWDLTWNLIELEGINQNIFNPINIGGNSIALKLVIEGMRLQPCRPGFVDARNAILKADSIFFNKKYSCIIWKSFARRGLGKNATQGSSNSSKDQAADFNDDIGGDYKLVQQVNQQYESGCISYTNTITASVCYDLNHFTIRDTIPSNVRYLYGGSYDSINRVVSFDVDIPAGSTRSYSFSVQVMHAAYFQDTSILNDSITDNSFHSNWINYSTVGNDWTVSNEKKHSPMLSFKCISVPFVSDNIIQLRSSINIPMNTNAILSFQSLIGSESNWDGGVVEISNNDGLSWMDANPFFIQNGYNGKLNQSANPLAGRKAFTGNQVNFQNVLLDLSGFSGSSILVRFRFGSDENYSNIGWYIDDVNLLISPVVRVKSGVYDENNECHSFANIFCKIIGGNPFHIIQGSSFTGQLYSSCGPKRMNLSVPADSLERVYWYKDAFENNLLAISNNFITPVLDHTTTYWVSKKNIQTTCYAIYNCPMVALIHKIPSAPVTQDTSICGAQSILISAIVDNPNQVRWYDSINSFRWIDTGINFHTPIIQTSMKYYAESVSPDGCTSEIKTTICIKVNAIPPPIPYTRGAVKCSQDTVRLYAGPSANMRVQWFMDSSGLLPLKIDAVNRVSEFVIASLPSSTTYWVANVDTVSGCISTSKQPVLAFIYKSPSIPDLESMAHCGPGIFKFMSTSRLLNNERYIWYKIGGLSQPISTASNYTTPHLYATTSYYVIRKNVINGCNSEKKLIQAIVHTLPSPPSVIGDSTCGVGKVMLRALSSRHSLNWYTSYKGGHSVLYNVDSMQLYSLNATKSFYVSSRDTVTSCVSASRSKVTATYLPKLPATQNIAIPADIILRINHALPVEISCSTIRGAQKYIWDLPFGAIIDSGFNSRKIKVVFSAVHYSDTVRVSGYNGCIGQSKTVIWKKDSTPTNNKSSSIQLQNYLDDWDVVIFPNPSHSTFTLKMQNYQGGQFECKVVDLLGNLIDHGCWNGMSEITLGRRWRAGIYFLEVYHSGKVIRKKMVKI